MDGWYDHHLSFKNEQTQSVLTNNTHTIIIFYVFTKHTHYTFKGLVEKKSEPMDLITDRTFSGSYNLKQALLLAVDSHLRNIQEEF